MRVGGAVTVDVVKVMVMVCCGGNSVLLVVRGFLVVKCTVM